jgi:hypothetical protein
MCRLVLVVAAAYRLGDVASPPQLLLRPDDDDEPLLEYEAGEIGTAEKAWAK